MHSSVLVIGASNNEELEKALEPFYQLGCTMNQEEIKADDRSELEIEYTKDQAVERYTEDIAERPTEEQLSFFRDNFIEPSEEEVCREMYKEKHNNTRHAPNGYTGEDFAYGSYKMANGESSFFLISEENMKKCREWMKEHDISLWHLRSGQTKKDFVKENPDTHTMMTSPDSGLEWDEKLQGYGYYSNPNGFWDWYQVGGRWVGFFIIKEEKRAEAKIGEPAWMMEITNEDAKELRERRADVLKVGDIDFEAMEKNAKEYSAKEWDKIREMLFESKGDKTDEEAEKRFREILSSPEKETKEEYIERAKHFGVASIIYEGLWYDHENDGFYRCKNKGLEGAMISRDLPLFLKNMQEDTPLMLVDCHR